MPERLTRREVQCLRLAGRDLGNKAIAQALGISPSTVENHLTSAYAKLGTSDRRRAAGLVARDYPEHPHFAPTPMADPGAPGSGDRARGDGVPGASDPGLSRWILPAPPTRLLRMLGAILGSRRSRVSSRADWFWWRAGAWRPSRRRRRRTLSSRSNHPTHRGRHDQHPNRSQDRPKASGGRTRG